MIEEDFDVDGRQWLLLMRASHSEPHKYDYGQNECCKDDSTEDQVPCWIIAFDALKTVTTTIASDTVCAKDTAVALSTGAKRLCFIAAKTGLWIETLKVVLSGW